LAPVSLPETGMTSFTTPKDRDAWNAIRGYVYQIDLTIQRWLDLLPDQILELERGEDIDIVSRSLLANSEERGRLLEQVKHRDSSLTLKKTEAIAAIANFIQHRQTNPTTDILFQFTTNTKVARERPCLMPNQMAAIEAWECLRLGEVEARNRDDVITGILQILRNARKPSDLDQDTWEQFRNFIRETTNEQFFRFICKFHWKTKAPEARSLKSIIQKQLLDRQYAIDSLQAQEQYERLFWHVFSRLCERGIKQLTLEDLNTQLALPSLNTTDHATLENLKACFCEIDTRVTNLEQEQQQNNQLLANLSRGFQQLAEEQGIGGAVKYVVDIPILDIYPLVERPSLREETVQSLVQILINHTWIAIHGSLGSGKTQLAVLLVHYLQEHGVNCIWLRFRDLTVDQACLRFDRAVEIQVGSPAAGDFSGWYSKLVDCLESSTILVFDDLPRLERGDELEIRLTQLAQICRNRGIRLVSTSFYQLTGSLQCILGSQVLHTMQVPPFTNGEVADLFKKYGAPESFANSDWIPYLNSLANQNPSLLAAVADYLYQENWQVSSETLNALLQGSYNTSVNEETLNRILVAIQDDQSQELLYRLNLISGYFSTEDIQSLADVPPSIERPRQRLNHLLGVWIQRDTNNRLMVSPLVKALGSQDLSISVRQECHLTLGERIAHAELNQHKAFNAIFHFTQAGAFDKAGNLLLYALVRLEESEARLDDGGILLCWSQQHLPEEMSLGIRLLIRSFQISVSVKRSNSVTYLLSDLDRLLEQVGEQESGIVVSLVAILISKCPKQVGFLRLNYYFCLALRFSSTARLPNGSELSLPSEVPFESLIWVASNSIQSTTDLEAWIDILENLSVEQQERAFSGRVAELGCLSVADKLWIRESEKPAVDQDWQTVLAASQNLAESSATLDLELLWACAVCSEVIVLAQYAGDLSRAIEISEFAIDHASDDPRVHFLLKECLGRQFVFANRYGDAVTWLTQALEQSTEAYSSLRFYALLRLSQVIANEEQYLSIQYAQQAVNLARSSEEIPETEIVKALGELAIAKWLTTGLPDAFEAWDQAGEYLFEYRIDENSWKDLFVLYGHITGYFTALATTGNPPGNIATGETYEAPTRGIFMPRNSARSNFYDPSRDCFLPTQLALLAEAIGNDERAVVWAMKGIDMARETQQLLPSLGLASNIIPKLVLENRYAEVFDLAVEAGRGMAVLPQLLLSNGNVLLPGLNTQEALDSSETQVWRRAEGCAMILGVLPIIFYIANLAIRQPERARTQAADLAAICHEVSAMSDTQSLWVTATEIIDQIHLQGSTCAELINRYQDLSSPDKILPILGLMSATLQEAATLSEVLRVHTLIIEKVQDLFKAHSSTYRLIILPYFFNYWKAAVERVMFRFNNPQQVASMLHEVESLPIEQQGIVILRIVYVSLI
jgi:hypothetical protein